MAGAVQAEGRAQVLLCTERVRTVAKERHRLLGERPALVVRVFYVLK